ncbi:hypothetical protein [Rossellomorea marisflavi]|uniref:Uncharacterized protein n=1 Tax=Rossellomorea marisflavi TaxID=189381 RepID=A0A165LBQ4_9BACI|nr:hypothetical protein [Rossellomorea marisflavi]KZE51599.1 hypothetical protein AV649_13960 [Rossellomorea marisflavi]
MEGYGWIYHIILIFVACAALIGITVTVYSKVLKHKRKVNILYLLIIPSSLGIVGKLLTNHGTTLTRDDFNRRVVNGLDTHVFSVDAGFIYELWGISSWIAIIPLSLTILILTLTRIVR